MGGDGEQKGDVSERVLFVLKKLVTSKLVVAIIVAVVNWSERRG